MGDDGRHHARDDDGRKGADRERAEDLLEREEGAGQRSVEGGGDAGRRARGDHDLGARRVEPERAPEKGGQCRSEHRDRALAARRAAASERHRARRGPGERRAEREPAAFARHRSLDVGDVESLVAPARAAHDQVRERHPGPGEERPVGENPRLSQEDGRGEIENPVGQIDQPVERHHAEPAGHADGNGESQQDAVLVEVEGVEPVGEPVPDPAGLPGRLARRLPCRASGIGQRGNSCHATSGSTARTGCSRGSSHPSSRRSSPARAPRTSEACAAP